LLLYRVAGVLLLYRVAGVLLLYRLAGVLLLYRVAGVLLLYRGGRCLVIIQGWEVCCYYYTEDDGLLTALSMGDYLLFVCLATVKP